RPVPTVGLEIGIGATTRSSSRRVSASSFCGSTACARVSSAGAAAAAASTAQQPAAAASLMPPNLEVHPEIDPILRHIDRADRAAEVDPLHVDQPAHEVVSAEVVARAAPRVVAEPCRGV